LTSCLSWLNTRWMGHPVPALLSDIYDAHTYKKQQLYLRANKRAAMVERCFSYVVVIVILVCGLYGWLDNLCKGWTSSPALQLVIFLLFFNAFNTIISLPFAYYDAFVIEQRFGFNRTTYHTFWLDQIKSYFVTTVISAALLLVVYWLYTVFQGKFWLYATLATAVFIIFFSLFYSNLIVPLFNKQTPLAPGELRTAIEGAIAGFGSKFKDIYVIDGSKHSTKANAYFTGFGPKRRIVLYDTLIDQMTTAEIVAVLAHEFGHNKHRDMLKNMIMSIVVVALNLFIFSLLVGGSELPAALGGRAPSFVLSLVAFSLLYTPVDILFSPLGNAISRRAEYRADAFAASHGHGEALIGGLKKLSANNYSNLTPHPAVVWFSHSHPTLYQRIKAINTISANSKQRK